MTYGDVIDTYNAFGVAKEYLAKSKETIINSTPYSDNRVDAVDTISKAERYVEDLQKMFDDEMSKRRAYRHVEPEEPDDDKEDV